MLIGAFSDIHSNLEALTTVLDFFKRAGVQRLLCCGDLVGYGPDPHLCIELVRLARSLVVAGNHDYGVAGSTSINQFNQLAVTALHWTRHQLSESEITYLRNLPLMADFGQIHLVHSAPSAPAYWDYIHTLEDAEEEMGAFTSDICLIGHTHIPMVVEKISGKPARLIGDNVFPLRLEAKYLINVGSVGQPRDHDPRACCLIIDLDKHQAAFHRLNYDYPYTQQKIIAAGLPEYLSKRLDKGI